MSKITQNELHVITLRNKILDIVEDESGHDVVAAFIEVLHIMSAAMGPPERAALTRLLEKRVPRIVRASRESAVSDEGEGSAHH